MRLMFAHKMEVVLQLSFKSPGRHIGFVVEPDHNDLICIFPLARDALGDHETLKQNKKGPRAFEKLGGLFCSYKPIK